LRLCARAGQPPAGAIKQRASGLVAGIELKNALELRDRFPEAVGLKEGESEFVTGVG